MRTNLTLSMGYFPMIFKNGIIVLILLIPKPEKDPKYPINYRPITLLELPGKILEKIKQDYIIYKKETNKNLYEFRKKLETEIELMKLKRVIGLNHIKNTNIAARDIQKAFDKVWH